MRHRAFPLAVATAAALALACGDDRDDDPAGPAGGVQPTFSSLRENVFDRRCIQCHSGGAFVATNGGLDLLSGDAAAIHARLVNADAQGPGAATAPKRVVPGNPAASLLYLKVTRTDSNTPGFGSGMPFGAPGSLDEASKNAIRDWIQAGAANN